MLKDIMVYLDQTPACQSRLEAAITLAKQHAARLTGLCVYALQPLKNQDRLLAEIRGMFMQRTAGCGVAAEWLEVDRCFLQTGVDEMIGYYACFTDLLVVSQPAGADRDKQPAVISSLERLLLGSGRPVLVIPGHGSFPHIGERVMIAWKAGPKASRALHDAMPLLKSAKHVNLVTIGKTTFSPGEDERLSSYLALHDVPVSSELIPPGNLSVGDTLLNLVADDNIDLMVFGVHVTTRRGHLYMGDIGTYLLGHMTVPMLLSH
jgi:hypothetical protein